MNQCVNIWSEEKQEKVRMLSWQYGLICVRNAKTHLVSTLLLWIISRCEYQFIISRLLYSKICNLARNKQMNDARWFLFFLFQQLMASKSDALFRDAKSKLLEIRAQHSKRLDARLETKEEKLKKKKQKKWSDVHAWTWILGWHSVPDTFREEHQARARMTLWKQCWY